MNKHDIFTIPVQAIKGLKSGASRISLIVLTGMMIFFLSCQKEESNDVKVAGELSLSSSSADIILIQKNDANVAVTFNWTTGTNNGTGASISYVLQIDKTGNNFASPHAFDMGKAVYSKSFSVDQLNSSLLEEYGAVAGLVFNLEARVIAMVYNSPTTEQISPVMPIKVMPYEPVSTTLFIFGDATAIGWDATKAIALTPDADDPTVFVFKGMLGTGSYKFISTSGQFLPSYNRGADDNHIVYRTSDSEPDDKFTVTEAAVYKITVRLLDLTITATKLDQPPYDKIYMVGDATPNGWDIGNSTELIQDPDNPYIFTYMGVMKAGDFKFPVNLQTDWGQDMYMRVDDTHMYRHVGGASDDNKWSITAEGNYVITANIETLTLSTTGKK
jgi:hypothetical protein